MCLCVPRPALTAVLLDIQDTSNLIYNIFPYNLTPTHVTVEELFCCHSDKAPQVQRTPFSAPWS